MDTCERFQETHLHDKQHVYSHLYEIDITDKHYNRATRICKHFNIENLGGYHHLYLITDVYFLTDVLNALDRHMCLNYYGLVLALLLYLTMLGVLNKSRD